MSSNFNLPTYALADEERASLESAFIDFAIDESSSIDEAIGVARQRWVRSAPPLLRAFQDRLRANDLPALVIENLPIDDGVISGLRDPAVALASKRTRLSEGLLLGAASACGEPYGIASEGRGVINNLCPAQAHVDAHTGLGSARLLGLHIENALAARQRVRQSPDGLALIGVHGEPDGGPRTFIADARRALDLVGREIENTLRCSQAFYLRMPERWRCQGAPEGRAAAIVEGCGQSLTFCFAFYGDMMEAKGARARDALERFGQALEEVAVPVRIEPGTAVLINNRIAGHGRDSFRSTFLPDGSPSRWVQRAFWREDLVNFADFREVARRVYEPAWSY